MSFRRQGFTLIELMIVVAVVALLAAVALPSYQSYIRKSRRADAFIALSNVQMAQERWRASHLTYGTLTDLGMTASPLLSERGFYTIELTDANGSGSPSGTGFRVSATARNPGAQASDGACSPLSVTVSGALSPSYYGPVDTTKPGVYYGPHQDCWAR